ncbi:MAG TPA: cysteine desulfurase [Candidatus Hydrogenedentes bacterium]|nr:cysteine desulfurase [Candidatus Hydrogenedentota bacterium]HOJ69107.1 cysteine desulfurase [Candidatus Hydrogenedentota bacterium]HOK90400.1 cysteine desulfurase [Candidatus Hydrogenedentota bacterium]
MNGTRVDAEPAASAAISQGGPVSSSGNGQLDVHAVRLDFPALTRTVYGKPLVYLDNAATTHKPVAVLEAMDRFYRSSNANVHRGVHRLSMDATALYDEARRTLHRFFGTAIGCEIIFTRGATESLNLVAQSYGGSVLRAGDEVLVSWMEHHSNIVPWQMVCERTGAILRPVPIRDDGTLDMDAFQSMLSERVKIVAITHVSNALGTVNPIAEITRLVHDAGAVVVVDGAQAAPHLPVNLRELGADFYVAAGHKMYGPTGIGILYGRADLLERMPPWQGGGDMILSVSFEKTVYAQPPQKFEAGTPPIAEAVGLAAAAEYLMNLNMSRVHQHEQHLLKALIARLETIPGLRMLGRAPDRAGVVSFIMDCAHPHDIGQVLDGEGVAVRAGHHCAQPVMQRFGVPATTRVSLGLYNTEAEFDTLVAALHKVRRMFA